MRKPPDSIQKQLILGLTSMIAALYCLSSVGTFLFMRHSFIQQIDQHLERMAEDFMAETHRDESGVVVSEFHELELPDYQSAGDDTSAFYELWDHQGKTLLKSPSLRGNSRLSKIDSVTETPKVNSIILPEGQNGRVVYVKFNPKPEPPGTIDKTGNYVILAMAESTNRLSRTLFILTTTLSTTLFILAFTTFLLGSFFIRRACRPIVELGKLTDKIGPWKMDSRLPVDEAPSELRPLIVHFNQLIERLEEGITRERRFSIDIAHELRTPLAEMQILMEVGINSDYPNIEVGSIEDPRVIYERGEAVNRRMRKMIEVLTSIYHGETASLQIVPQPIDIGPFIAVTLDTFGKGVRDRFSFNEGNETSELLETDPDLFRAVLDNLLGNAVAHSPELAQISIKYCNREITIKNPTTEEFTREDLSKFDEPFWQKDAARSDGKHFGLGLTLVAVYMRILNGTVSRTSSNGTLTTRLTFD